MKKDNTEGRFMNCGCAPFPPAQLFDVAQTNFICVCVYKWSRSLNLCGYNPTLFPLDRRKCCQRKVQRQQHVRCVTFTMCLQFICLTFRCDGKKSLIWECVCVNVGMLVCMCVFVFLSKAVLLFTSTFHLSAEVTFDQRGVATYN